MNSTPRFFDQASENISFWQRIVNSDDLRECDDLEKILVGCEIIAALDSTDLLAA